MKNTVAFAKDAVNIFFHILTACNLSCRHCYINPQQHGTRTLPLATVEAWLDLFADRAPRANVVILGGEPTLHPDLAAILKKARRLNVASLTVDTNGSLCHDILAKISPSVVDYFSFSLDGVRPETNDRIRGAGAYDTCLKGIRAAVTAGFNASVIYTVSRLNLDELRELGPMLDELGVRRLFIQVIGIRGKSAAEGNNALQVSRRQWVGTVPPAAEEINRRGIAVTYPKVFLEPDEAFACAGRVADNYFIFPNGRVYRCPLCEDYPIHSLNVSENRLVTAAPINEADLFRLDIPEGCVMNKLVQPANLRYRPDGTPEYKVACCLLKEDLSPPNGK